MRECEIYDAARLPSETSWELALRCLGPKGPDQACANGASPQRKMAPGEREHSDPKGHAGPSAATRSVNSGTRERGSDSDRRRRAPFPSAPGEELRSSCARDRSRTAETQSGSIHASPMRRSRTRATGRFHSWEELDFLARIGLRVIDPDLKHGKTLLEFLCAGLGAVSGRKFALLLTIHLKRETRSRRLCSGCNHLISIVR